MTSNAPFSDYPDRRWIEHVYLPALHGRVLYVGMDFYTAHYPELATGASEFVFIDHGDSAERFAHLGVIHADFFDYRSEEPFDHVALYGVTGYGTPFARIEEQVAHADELLRPGGTVLFGPNQPLPPARVPEEHRDWEKRLHEYPPAARHFLESLRPAEFWREFFARPPLDRYTVIADAEALPQIESNYVWWGRKPT